MENVMTMTNGFIELSAMDMCEIDGGVDWGWIGSGVAVAGAALFVAGVVSTFYGNPMGPDAAALGAYAVYTG